MPPVRGSSRESSPTSAIGVYDPPVPKRNAKPKPDRTVSDETELLQRYAATGMRGLFSLCLKSTV